MIIGIGVDVCDLERFQTAVARTPAMLETLLTPTERDLPTASRAARFAAKEALAKALGAPEGLSWQDAEVVRAAGGQPRLELRGSVAAAADRLGVRHAHLSISHDAGLATAFVVLEGDPGEARS